MLLTIPEVIVFLGLSGLHHLLFLSGGDILRDVAIYQIMEKYYACFDYYGDCGEWA